MSLPREPRFKTEPSPSNTRVGNNEEFGHRGRGRGVRGTCRGRGRGQQFRGRGPRGRGRYHNRFPRAQRESSRHSQSREDFIKEKYRQLDDSARKRGSRDEWRSGRRRSRTPSRSTLSSSRSVSRSPSRLYRRRHRRSSSHSSSERLLRPRNREKRSYSRSRSPDRNKTQMGGTSFESHQDVKIETGNKYEMSHDVREFTEKQVSRSCSPVKEILRITIDNEHCENVIQPQHVDLPQEENREPRWRIRRRRNHDDDPSSSDTPVVKYHKVLGERDMDQFADDVNPGLIAYTKESDQLGPSSSVPTTPAVSALEFLSRLTNLVTAQPPAAVSMGKYFSQESMKFDTVPFIDNSSLSVSNSSMDAFRSFEVKSQIASKEMEKTCERVSSAGSSELDTRSKVHVDSPRISSPLSLIPGLGDLPMGLAATEDDDDKYLYGEDSNDKVLRFSESPSIETSSAFIKDTFEASLRNCGIDLKKPSRIADQNEDTVRRGEEVVRQVNDMMRDPRLRKRSSTSESASSYGSLVTPTISEQEVHGSQGKSVISAIPQSNVSPYTAFPQHLSPPPVFYNPLQPPPALPQDMPLPRFGQKQVAPTTSSNLIQIGKSMSRSTFSQNKSKSNAGNLKVVTLVNQDQQTVAARTDQKSDGGERNSEIKSASTSNPQCNFRPIVNSKDRESAVRIIETRRENIKDYEKQLEVLKSKEIELTRRSQRKLAGHTDPDLVSNNLAQQRLQRNIEVAKNSIEDINKKMAKYDLEKASRVTAEVKLGSSSVGLAPKCVSKRSGAKEGNEGAYPKQKSVPSTSQIQYRFVDYGSHWCKHCSDVFPHVNNFLKHLHSDHVNVMEDLPPTDRPWVVKPKEFKEATTVQPSPIKGVEFMLPCLGFFCNLCKEFYGDLVASQVHLESESHNINYQKFVRANHHYEKKIECEKNISLLKKREDNERKLEKAMNDAFVLDKGSEQLSNDTQVPQVNVISEPAETVKVTPSPISSIRLNLKNKKEMVNKPVTVSVSTETPDCCHTITKPGAKIAIKLKDNGVSSSVIKDAIKIVDASKPMEKPKEVQKDSPFKLPRKGVVLRLPTSRGQPPPLEEFITIGESSAPLTYDDHLTPSLRITPQIQFDPQIKIKSEPKDSGYEKYMGISRSVQEEGCSVDENAVIGPQLPPNLLKMDVDELEKICLSEEETLQNTQLEEEEIRDESETTNTATTFPLPETEISMEMEDSQNDDCSNNLNLKIVSAVSIASDHDFSPSVLIENRLNGDDPTSQSSFTETKDIQAISSLKGQDSAVEISESGIISGDKACDDEQHVESDLNNIIKKSENKLESVGDIAAFGLTDKEPGAANEGDIKSAKSEDVKADEVFDFGAGVVVLDEV